ncbi:MAG: peptide deformylase [Candidatus Omnitrophica bacterium]|nr:peptide deformylase [Candidatus Omnitrophota bacterium]
MKNSLQIQLYGSPLLQKKCKKVEKADSRINELLDEMLFLMRMSKGVGLAANQAGLDLSLVVIENEDKVYKLINPKITKRKGKIIFTEGCLSFPGLEISVPRSEQVWVSFLDEQSRPVDIKAGGLLAVILQHEIDHINGVVFTERIAFWRRFAIRKKLKRIKQLYRDSQGKK